MKKLVILLALVLCLVIYFSSSHYGVALGPFKLSLEPDKHTIELGMRRFLEDIKFKDFVHAATLHTAADRKVKDIPRLIEDKFQIKPELMDIRDFEVLRVETMSTGHRAKVLVKVFVKLLNSNQDVREVDAVFFFKKDTDGRWYMDLQSSL